MKVRKDIQNVLNQFQKVARMAPELEARKPYRRHGFVYFSLTFPYFLMLSLLIRVSSLVSSLKKTRQRYAKFVRHYFKTFFKWIGVYHHVLTPLPTPLKPAIFFSVKQIPMESPFIYQLFDAPIIVPLDASFYAYRAFRFFPSSFLGKMMRCIGYPEQPLSVGYAAIKSILDSGYSVVVMLNEIPGDPKIHDTLYIQKEVTALMDAPVDKYLLRLSGFDDYYYATPFHPLDISVNCEPLKDIIKDAPTQTVTGMGRIVDYFGYKGFQIGVPS